MMKQLFLVMFFFICITLSLTATAQVVSIPDPNLRAAIENALGKASGAIITTADMANLTRLDARNANISNLAGLEQATNLTGLYLDGEEVSPGVWENSNSVSDLSPLAGLTQLTELDLWVNSVSDISALAGLTNLTHLGLVGNNISDVSVLTGLANLESLWLDGNLISDISPVAGLTQVARLGLESNNISDISALAGLTNLTFMRAGWNNISDLSPLVANTGLGSGDTVNVKENPLNHASIETHIPVLQSRGVTVEFNAVIGTVSSSVTAITEVVISAETIRDFGETSPQNTAFVRDADASNGLAFQFTGGANNPPVANPTAWWEVEFWCEAGTYYIWARGKSDGNNQTDAFWLQFDDQIGTTDHTADPDFVNFGLGNWRDVFDAGIYKWLSQGIPPFTVVTWTTNRTGLHRVRAQARQTPHYLDQLLISQHQDEQPADTAWPTEFPRRDPRIATNEISAIDTKGTQIYWTDKDISNSGSTTRIRHANLDGTNVQDLVTGLRGFLTIALDVVDGKMYWAGEGKIQRANLDGTNIEYLVAGLGHRAFVALDVEGGKMYWTDWGPGKIQRANLDGTNIEYLVTGLVSPKAIALNVAGGKMYWTGADKIQRANLDGTNREELITGLELPFGIALDVEGGKIYWTNPDFNGSKIQRANLDGTNVQDLVTGSEIQVPLGIALDVEGGKMYWADEPFRIRRANLDGTDVQDLVTGLDLPYGIALAISPDLPPARADVNQDGRVNITDLLLVVSALGDTAPTLLFGDVNGDKRVTIDDVLLVIEALDEPVTAAAPANDGGIHALEGTTLEAHLNRLRSQSDGSLKYQRAIAFFQNLLASVAPPDRTELLANYPNPFNPETWIPYRLAEDAFVTLTIYDGTGHIVRTLDVGHRIAAVYENRSKAAYWDGRNDLGERVASGVYFYQLQAGSASFLRKMVILK